METRCAGLRCGRTHHVAKEAGAARRSRLFDLDRVLPSALYQQRSTLRSPVPLPQDLDWIGRAPKAPYLMTESGEDWHPIGHNEAISWPNLAPLFRDANAAPVDAHLAMLAAHGVTVLRVMLDYAQFDRWTLERPVGRFRPQIVARWDVFFALCARHGIRLLLTPFDTFWMWLRFKRHPYSAALGGPLRHPSEALTCLATRAAIKNRLSFAVRRWGGSGVVFAWDLWNEIHPAHGGDSAEPFAPFITDLSEHVRGEEMRLFGRTHLQTVSLFGPELVWRAHMPLEEPIFRHPLLDLATIHIYEQGTIDAPRNTVDPASAMGRIVAKSVAAVPPLRPFFDSEHGPIHTFKDHRRTLSAAFDDEYFRLMSWAHLASGGAGGGMRWPNRHPHSLTPGMHAAQAGMARFMPLIDWQRFDRRIVSSEVVLVERRGAVGRDKVVCSACVSADQAVIHLIRRDRLDRKGLMGRDVPPRPLALHVPGLRPGTARITIWSTEQGKAIETRTERIGEGALKIPDLVGDVAIAIQVLEGARHVEKPSNR